METIKSLFVKPDPNAQLRKCTSILRANQRKLDRDILATKAVETKTKNLILAADRRATLNPSRAPQARAEARLYASELIRTRRASSRLATTKAQLGSVQMQVTEAFAMRKLEGSIRASVGVMKDVNSLVRLPEFAATMRELQVELMKAGIIEEMVGESLPVDDGLLEGEEEEEAEGEVDRVLGEILKGRMEKTGTTPVAPMPAEKVSPVAAAPVAAEEEDEEDEDAEAMMDQMRDRLQALRS